MRLARVINRYSGRIRGAQRISERWIPYLAAPMRWWAWWGGHEDFYFPGTGHLIDQAPFHPDVLHLHNLHGDYFDLRELPGLSHAVPTIITLHDAWMLAGHCSHSFACERWKTGCGVCPDLDISPAIRRDASAFNWQRKKAIYRHSQLSVVCPSQWLADKVRQSILMEGVQHLEVINNGVNTSVFKPGDKAAAREILGWPQDAFVVLFAASGIKNNIWKDYVTMRKAIRLAGERVCGRSMRFFAVGEAASDEQVGSVKIEFLPYRDALAECYQAADVYLHAAKAEAWGLVITEALACGTPAVATAVGGIPEQIVEGETGFLVPPGDALAMAECLIRLAQSSDLLHRMGAAAAKDAAERFSLERMVSGYDRLYQNMIESRNLYT